MEKSRTFKGKMKNNILRVSVIIPTYNRCQTLKETINSFQNQSFPANCYEIIVVDNNSTDDTAKVVEEIKENSNVEISYLKESRQGVHYARNTAAQIAKYNLLYYTDDDIIADPNALSEIIKPYIECRICKIGSVGGNVRPKWEIEPPKWVRKYFNNASLSIINHGDTCKSLSYPGIASCHMIIGKNLLIKSGGFHPENTAGVWIGDGETGLLKKVLKKGYGVVYMPTSIVWHVIPKTRMTQEYMNLRFFNEGACSSYAQYKEHMFSKIELIYRSLAELTLCWIKMIVSITKRILQRDSWHVTRAQASYWYSRHRYGLKLAINDSFRELVLKENWIE